MESAHSAIEVKDLRMEPETPNASQTTLHFWREMQMETHQARQVDLSRLRRSRSAASRPNKARSARHEVYIYVHPGINKGGMQIKHISLL